MFWSGQDRSCTAAKLLRGRVAERTKATVLKTVSGATRSWVRIPPLPLALLRWRSSRARSNARRLAGLSASYRVEPQSLQRRSSTEGISGAEPSVRTTTTASSGGTTAEARRRSTRAPSTLHTPRTLLSWEVRFRSRRLTVQWPSVFRRWRAVHIGTGMALPPASATPAGPPASAAATTAAATRDLTPRSISEVSVADGSPLSASPPGSSL